MLWWWVLGCYMLFSRVRGFGIDIVSVISSTHFASNLLHVTQKVSVKTQFYMQEMKRLPRKFSSQVSQNSFHFLKHVLVLVAYFGIYQSFSFPEILSKNINILLHLPTSCYFKTQSFNLSSNHYQHIPTTWPAFQSPSQNSQSPRRNPRLPPTSQTTL